MKNLFLKKISRIGLGFCLSLSLITIPYMQTNAETQYLEPTTIDNEDYFNAYDLVEIKNGIVEDKNDSILGKGKAFYINDNLLTLYENSIVMKLNDGYIPISQTQYVSDGYSIVLPKQVTSSFDDPFYITKKQVRDYFEIDVESQGIQYETIEYNTTPVPVGVSFNFLKSNITTLGYEVVGDDVYQYVEETGQLNNVVYFYDGYITIHWIMGTNQNVLNLLLQSLFPNSYIQLASNLTSSNGTFDNRHFDSYVWDDYIEINVSNLD